MIFDYIMSKGAVPTVEVRSAEQAHRISQALGWRLSEEEIVRIDKVSMEEKVTVLCTGAKSNTGFTCKGCMGITK